MRTIILGLLGATMLSSVAQAACNDIPNPTRFNPTELSAYQECWLDKYKADETAGIIGSLAWVRLNGEYFSASLSMIRKNPGSYSEKFLAAIEDQLTDYTVKENEARIEEVTTIVEIVEKIVENGETIDALRDEVKRLKDANANLDDMIKEKNDRIKELIAENTNLEGNIVQLKLDIDWYETRAIRAVSFVSHLHSQAVGGYAPSANGTWIDHADYRATYDAIVDLKSNLATAQANQVTYDDEFYVTNLESSDAVFEEDVDVSALNNPDYTWGIDLADYDALEIGDRTIVKVNGVWIEADSNMNNSATFSTSYDSGDEAIAIHMNGSSSQITNINLGETISYAVSLTTGIDMANAILDLEEMIKDAFNDGYDEGYSDGYSDGYADGFADGVDSVTP